MAAVAADRRQRLRVVDVELDPQQRHVVERADEPQEALGAGVEVDVEHELDVGPGAVAQRLQVHQDVADERRVHVQAGRRRRAEAGHPAVRPAALVAEQVGLERREALLAGIGAGPADAVEVGDRRCVVVGMVDAPARAVRPVDRHRVAMAAAEEVVHRDAERLRLRVEQRVLDRAERLAAQAVRRRPRGRRERAADRLVVVHVAPGQPLGVAPDDRREAGRPEALVELAPAHDAGVRDELEEVVRAPAAVAGQRLEALDPHPGIFEHVSTPRPPISDSCPFCRCGPRQ